MSLSNLSVFVYGTLKPGGRYWPEFCEGKVGEPVPGKIRGVLYDLRLGYPGLLLKNEGWAYGHILTFKAEKDFLRLDYLEGYDPNRPYAANEYIRKIAPVYSRKGEPLGKAWAYEITEHVLERCQGTRIADGDWPV